MSDRQLLTKLLRAHALLLRAEALLSGGELEQLIELRDEIRAYLEPLEDES